MAEAATETTENEPNEDLIENQWTEDATETTFEDGDRAGEDFDTERRHRIPTAGMGISEAATLVAGSQGLGGDEDIEDTDDDDRDDDAMSLRGRRLLRRAQRRARRLLLG